jgi:hypothetical protein
MGPGKKDSPDGVSGIVVDSPDGTAHSKGQLGVFL